MLFPSRKYVMKVLDPKLLRELPILGGPKTILQKPMRRSEYTTLFSNSSVFVPLYSSSISVIFSVARTDEVTSSVPPSCSCSKKGQRLVVGDFDWGSANSVCHQEIPGRKRSPTVLDHEPKSHGPAQYFACPNLSSDFVLLLP